MSPAAHQQEESSSHDDHHHQQQQVQYVTPAPIVRKSTTLRTIIRPDSKTYETNSGVHVTFDHPDNHHSKSDKHVGDASEKHETFANLPQNDFGTSSKDKRNSQYFGINAAQNVIPPHNNLRHPSLVQELPVHHQPIRFNQQPHDVRNNFNQQHQQNYFPNQPQQQLHHQQYQQQQQFRQQQPPIQHNRPIQVTSQPPQHNFNPNNNHVKFPPSVVSDQRYQQFQQQPQQQQQQQVAVPVKTFQQQNPFNFVNQQPHPNLLAHPLPPQFQQQQFKTRPQQQQQHQQQPLPVAEKQVQPGIKYHHQQSANTQAPFNHHTQQQQQHQHQHQQTAAVTSFPRFNHEQPSSNNNNVFQGGLVQQNAPNLVNKHQHHQQQHHVTAQVHTNNLIKSAFGGDVVQVQASLPKFEHHITEQYNPPIFVPSKAIDTQIKQQQQPQQQQTIQKNPQQPQPQQQQHGIQLNDHFTNQFAQISNYYSDAFPQQKSNMNERLQALNNFDLNNYKINQPTTARNYPIEASTTPRPPPSPKVATQATARPSPTTTPRATTTSAPLAVAQLPDEVPDDLREVICDFFCLLPSFYRG